MTPYIGSNQNPTMESQPPHSDACKRRHTYKKHKPTRKNTYPPLLVGKYMGKIHQIIIKHLTYLFLNKQKCV